MTPDHMDAVQETVGAEQDAAVATYLAIQQRQARDARVAEANRPPVPHALKRCHGCGELIGEARLRLLPGTGLCMPCATEAETQLKKDLYA